MKKALLVIDYIYDFVADDGKLTCGKPGQDLEQYIVNLINDFKENGEFIVEATDKHDIDDIYDIEKEMFPAHSYDEKGQALYGEVKDAVEAVPANQYLKVDKLRYSAFCATNLDLKLKERDVKEVHLVGVCTDICILHAAVDAFNLGYKVVVHEKGVASFNQEGHDYSLTHFKNVLAAQVI